MSVEIVSRAEWEAEPGRSIPPVYHPVPSVFLTYTSRLPCEDDESCLYAVRKIQYSEIYKGRLADVPFNFAIGGNGKVYEGRGWHLSPTLPVRYSEFSRCSLLVAYIGNYYETDIPETPLMREVFENLMIFGVTNRFINKKIVMYKF